MYIFGAFILISLTLLLFNLHFQKPKAHAFPHLSLPRLIWFSRNRHRQKQKSFFPLHSSFISFSLSPLLSLTTSFSSRSVIFLPRSFLAFFFRSDFPYIIPRRVGCRFYWFGRFHRFRPVHSSLIVFLVVPLTQAGGRSDSRLNRLDRLVRSGFENVAYHRFSKSVQFPLKIHFL